MTTRLFHKEGLFFPETSLICTDSVEVEEKYGGSHIMAYPIIIFQNLKYLLCPLSYLHNLTFRW